MTDPAEAVDVHRWIHHLGWETKVALDATADVLRVRHNQVHAPHRPPVARPDIGDQRAQGRSLPAWEGFQIVFPEIESEPGDGMAVTQVCPLRVVVHRHRGVGAAIERPVILPQEARSPAEGAETPQRAPQGHDGGGTEIEAPHTAGQRVREQASIPKPHAEIGVGQAAGELERHALSPAKGIQEIVEHQAPPGCALSRIAHSTAFGLSVIWSSPRLSVDRTGAA